MKEQGCVFLQNKYLCEVNKAIDVGDKGQGPVRLTGHGAIPSGKEIGE
jgi:hypothetical protein